MFSRRLRGVARLMSYATDLEVRFKKGEPLSDIELVELFGFSASEETRQAVADELRGRLDKSSA